MMRKSIIFLTFKTMALALLATGCSDDKKTETEEHMAAPAFDLAAAREEIVAANRHFMELYSAGDSAGVADLYAPEAKFMMNGAPAISGKDNIRSTMSAILNSGISRVDLRTVDVWGTEDLIAEEGELSLFSGDKEVDKGKYIVLWKKVDGTWRLFRDMFNSDLPPAPPAD